MALDANGIPQTPAPQDGASEGGEKLYGGKWKTLEEAVDKGYTGLEKGYHDTREELAAVRRLIEERLPERGEAYNPSEQYVRRSEPADPEATNRAILSEFYSDPQGFKDRIKRETLTELENTRKQGEQLQGIYNQWAGENPDISQEIPLIDFYVRQQSTSLSPRQRLERAAPLVREHIRRLRAPTPAAAPGPNDHVENPGGGRAPAAPAKPVVQSQEESLASYLAERNRMRKPVPRRG